MGAITELGKTSLTYSRTNVDSLDLVIHDGVFKNFTLDRLGRLQYNSSRWRQRARIISHDGNFISVHPQITEYTGINISEVLSNRGYDLHEVTVRINSTEMDSYIFIPLSDLANTDDPSILVLRIGTTAYSTNSYNDYISRVPDRVKEDGPDVSNFRGYVIIGTDGSTAVSRISEFLTPYDFHVEVGYTSLSEGGYLLHFLYLGDYIPEDFRYTTSETLKMESNTDYYLSDDSLGSVLILENKIRGKMGDITEVILYDDEIHYKDEVITSSKHGLLTTDLVKYISGDVSVLDALEDGFTIKFFDDYDGSAFSTLFYRWFDEILNLEYYFRCIMIDEVLDWTVSDLDDFYNSIGSSGAFKDLDNLPNISFVFLFSTDLTDHLRPADIAIGSDLYDSLGRLASSPMDVFYSVVRNLDSIDLYDNYIVKHNRPGVRLINLMDPRELNPGESSVADRFCYRSDQLDDFLLELYKSTFHACINKHREEIISSSDKESAIAEALSAYEAPEAYEFKTSQTEDETTIECKVSYKSKIGIININFNTIING